MSRNVIIHIGLHKTATRFLQKNVFASLGETFFEYNPPQLMTDVHAAFREPQNTGLVQTAVDTAARYTSADGKPLLISKCDFPGDMYYAYQTHIPSLALMKRIFPRATIIYFVRNPADWLLSAYKQSLVKGNSGTIECFLNFYDGGFQPKMARYMDGMRNIAALELPFLSIYEECRKHYGRENVNVFCYEDLRSDSKALLGTLANCMKVGRLPVESAGKRRNRSFSARAIQLFFPRWRFFRTTPKPSESLPPRWKRRLLSPFRQTRANFIRHIFDKISYQDWDLLERHNMRSLLKEKYKAEYAQLGQLAAETARRNRTCE
jgi:hypothetical protein